MRLTVVVEEKYARLANVSDVAHDTGVSFAYAIINSSEGLRKSCKKKKNIEVLGINGKENV